MNAALQIRHKQCGRNTLAGNIGQYKPDAAGTEVEKIVIGSADGARLNALTRVIKGSQRRLGARQKFALNGASYCEFLKQRLVIGSRREIEVPDIGFRAQALDTSVAGVRRSGQAEPHYAKNGRSRATADLEKLS